MVQPKGSICRIFSNHAKVFYQMRISIPLRQDYRTANIQIAIPGSGDFVEVYLDIHQPDGSIEAHLMEPVPNAEMRRFALALLGALDD